MFENRAQIVAAMDAGEAVDFVYFYGHGGSKEKRCLSNFFPAPFVTTKSPHNPEDGTSDHLMPKTYPTSEHWYMAAKALVFGDDETYQAIMATDDPAEAKRLGRRVEEFDDEVWWEGCDPTMIMFNGCLLKFRQNEWCREYLLGTGDSVLVEAAPRDTNWGVGLSIDQCRETNDPMEWRGANHLGFTLMRVRERLRDERSKDGGGETPAA